MSSNYKINKSGRSLDLAYQLGAMTIIGLFSFNAHAECTPTPDCASIGYTETSCETDYLACPFDSSKLKCIPCDSSFRYDCSGDNITGGEGDTCGGKYVSCTCSSTDYIFYNGSCICKTPTSTDCTVGAIYYADGKCSNDYIACLNPVGIIVKDNALVMNWTRGLSWSASGTNISDLPDQNYSTLKTDYNGKDNTAKIVAHFGEDADITKNAGVFCYNYTPVGMESSKRQWYLPAGGELYDYIYGNYDTLNNIYTTHLGTAFPTIWFWSSCENKIPDGTAFLIRSYDGAATTDFKTASFPTTCFLEIN